jgi:hypothetical protein
MKYLGLVFLFLVGCGSSDSGGPSLNGNPPNLPPTCKSIYSVWESDLDQESFDFTSLEFGPDGDYSYTASNGLTCGYANNPNHELVAELHLRPAGAPFYYRLEMDYSLEIGSTCDRYKSGTAHNAYIAMDTCNEIEVCVSYSVNTLIDCKTFR